MKHKLFKPKTLSEAQHAAVGNCNGMTMEDRWSQETPLFAKNILKYVKDGDSILDYGCGPGRLLKGIADQNSSMFLFGTDNSKEMRDEAEKYVNKPFCSMVLPTALGDNKFNLIYCVYVLQHVPAIEIREILSRIHHHLEDDGVFVYCSSDYRMAIRHDSPGFFDDRFLGVNLLEEVERFFDYKEELFSEEDYRNNKVLRTMVLGEGGVLPHPAKVFVKKKNIVDYFHEANETVKEVQVYEEIDTKEELEVVEALHDRGQYIKGQKKLLLINRLAPGDILVMSNAIRDLHKAYPDEYLTEVRSPCNELFDNNPYVTKFHYDEEEYQKINQEFGKHQVGENPILDMGDVKVIDMHYPMIHRSGTLGAHFAQGHTEYLAEVLGKPIPVTDLRPQIFLSEVEKQWASPVAVKKGLSEPYWVLNAGSKGDYTLKQYPYYQEVVSQLQGVNLVQVGVKGHLHEPLDGVIDMVGETNIRELARLIYHAQGVITCVSLPMHIAAAFNKPCVVVAGAREGTRWELYPNHQFLYVNGCLPCARYDGCWRSKVSDCDYKKDGVPTCMTLIKPEDIVRAVERYYDGGMLQRDELLVTTGGLL